MSRLEQQILDMENFASHLEEVFITVEVGPAHTFTPGSVCVPAASSLHTQRYTDRHIPQFWVTGSLPTQYSFSTPGSGSC